MKVDLMSLFSALLLLVAAASALVISTVVASPETRVYLNLSETDVLVGNRWAMIEDVNSDCIKVETNSDEVWAKLVQLYQNGSERWIGGIVERYENEWGFRFDPDTIMVAEVTIEVWQTTIRGISENLDYWLGEMAVVGARVIEIHSPPPVGGVWIPIDKFSLLAPYIGLISTIIIATVVTAIHAKRKKRNT